MGTFINITVIVIAVLAVGLMIWTKIRNKSCCGCSGNCKSCSQNCESREKQEGEKNE